VPLLALTLSAGSLSASTIKDVKLADGHEADNTIGAPLYDAAGAGTLKIGAIESAYDKKAKIVRAGGGFMTKGPKYDLDPGVDLSGLLTESLRAEAQAMGFKVTQGNDADWEVSGSLKDIYLDSRQVPYGATQFWGYLLVDLQVKKKGAAPTPITLRAHKYYASFNAGMGRKDEATEGLQQLLVEGAQELIARLNRAYFKAPPTAAMIKLAGSLTAGKDNDVHVVGLSGATAAVPVLMKLIPAAADNERNRADLIGALGRIGSPEAVPFLAGRFAKEEDDGRWETLKAMDYIGGDEAKAVLTQGTKDKNDACKRLAGRILETSK
jgi:hypothetical protein